MRQFLLSNSINFVVLAKRAAKQLERRVFGQIKSLNFKLAQELLQHLESMTIVSQEKPKWQ